MIESAFNVIPLVDTCALAFNSPVLALYEYLVSLVLTASRLPEVESVNSGYWSVTVVVSFETVTDGKSVHVKSVPSKNNVVFAVAEPVKEVVLVALWNTKLLVVPPTKLPA